MSKPNQPISVLQVTALTPWTRLRLRRSSPLPHNTRPRLLRNRPISVPLPCLSDASDRPLEVDNPAAAAAAASLDSRTISSVKQSQKKRSLSSFTVGEVVEGVVKNVVPFGCFVDVGGVEDILVHISDFANAFCNDPSKFVQKGEEVKLEVIQVEANKMKGSFKGLMGFEETVKESSSSSSSSSSSPSAAPKRRTPEKDYSITEVFEGVVERVTVSGAIVRFDNEESTGFLPVEELPDAKIRQASEIKTSDLIQVGQKLEVRVMEYQSRNSILLTTKSVTEVEEDKAMESEGLFISDIKPSDYAIFKTAFKKAGLISNMFTEEVKEATGIDDVELQTVMESEAPVESVESVEIPEVQSSDVNEASVLKDQTEASAGTKNSAEKPPAITEEEDPILEIQEQETEAQSEAEAKTEEVTVTPPVIAKEEPIIEIQEQVTEVQQEAITETEEISEIPAPEAEETPAAKVEEPVAELEEQVTEAQEEAVAVTEETTEAAAPTAEETPVVEIEEPVIEIQEQVTKVQQEVITETEEITEIPAPDAEEKPVAKMEEPVAEPQKQVAETQEEAVAVTEEKTEVPPAITKEEEKTPVVEIEEPVAEIPEQVTEAQQEAITETEETTEIPAPEAEETPVANMEEPVAELEEQVTEAQEEAVAVTEETTEVAPSITKEEEKTPVVEIEEPIAEIQEQVTEVQQEAITETEEITEIPAPDAEEKPVAKMEEPVAEPQEQVTEATEETVAMTEETTEAAAAKAEEIPVVEIEEPVIEIQEQVTESENKAVAAETTEVLPAITKEEETPVVKAEEPVAEIQDQLTETQEETAAVTEETTETPAPKEQVTDGQEKIVTEMEPPTSTPKAEETPVVEIEEPAVEIQEQVTESENEAVAAEITEVPPAITKEEETPVVEIEEPVAELQEQVTEAQQEAITETEETTEIPAPEAEETPVAKMEEPVAEPQEQVAEAQEEAVAVTEETTEVPPAITKEEEKTPVVEIEEPVAEIPEQVTEDQQESVSKIEEATEVPPVIVTDETVIEIQEQTEEAENETEVEPEAPSLPSEQQSVAVPLKQESKSIVISAKLVKELREITGAGMLDCKKALVESKGDIESAMDYLKKKGIASAAKRAGRIATEGLISSYVHHGDKLGILLEVNSETDFVSRSDQFKDFVNDVAMTIASCPDAICISPEDFPLELLEKEREIEMSKEELLSKPEGIREKIVSGKLEKLKKTGAVLKQPFIRNQEIKVEDALNELAVTLGEKISIRQFERYVLGEGLEKKSTDFASEVTDQIEAKKAQAIVSQNQTAQAETAQNEIAQVTLTENETAQNEDVQNAQPELAPEAPVYKVSAVQVKELRLMTGGGMLDCKKALLACQGDMDAASEFLRKKGLAGAAKKADRLASEGAIGCYVHTGSKLGVMVEVNCETDFVSRSELFKELVQDIKLMITACPEVQYITNDEIPQSVKDKELQLEMQKEDLLTKPENIRQKIAEGRVGKTLQVMCLFDQPTLKDSSKTVREMVQEAIAALGENIRVRRFVRFNLGEGIEKKEANFAEEVAQQVEKTQA